MRRSAIIASLLLATAASAANAQDAVLLRLGGQAGQTNRYQGVMEIFIRGGQMAAMMNPDTTLPMMRITTFNTRTLASVAGDTLVFTEVIDSARMESPAMPQMAAMAGAMTAQMRGQTTTSRMDARGRIFRIETTNPNGEMGGGRGRGMGSMGGNQRTLFMLPAQAVRVGETWSDSMFVAGATPNEPSSNLVATMKLERVDMRGSSRVAVISMNGNMAQNGGASGPVRFTVNGEFQVDLSANRLASISMIMLGTMNNPQMGETPMKMQMTQTLMP